MWLGFFAQFREDFKKAGL